MCLGMKDIKQRSLLHHGKPSLLENLSFALTSSRYSFIFTLEFSNS
jgi:hypothetical protein